MKDVLYVTREHANDWKEIGLELKLGSYMLDVIEVNYPYDNKKRFFAMIQRWLVTDCDPTWKALEVALTNVNRKKSGLDPVDDVYGMLTHKMNLIKATKLVIDIIT